MERARKNLEILTLNGIRFSHNEVFLYTKEQEGTSVLHRKLFEALASSNSAYRFPLLGIRARGGLVNSELFKTVSGFPLTARQKRPSCDDALKYLIEAGLLRQYDELSYITVAFDFAPDTASVNRLRARMAAEQIALLALRDWLRLQGFISTDIAHLRTENPGPQFGFFQWDFTAPSYIQPLSSRDKKGFGPGFIVADVILGRVLSLNDVQPFVHKVNAARNYKNNRPFMSILIADWFEKDAFLFGRQNGLVFTTPKNFFGKPLSEFLDDFTQAYEHKDSFIDAEPDYLVKLLQNLQALSHLHHVLEAGNESIFRLLLGYCLSHLEDGPPTYKTEVGLQPVNVDIFVGNKSSTAVCDTFWLPDFRLLDRRDIVPWIEHLPNLFTALKSQRLFPARAYICTNTCFTADAIELLEAASKEFDIVWLDQIAILAMLTEINKELHDVVTRTLLKIKPAKFEDNF